MTIDDVVAAVEDSKPELRLAIKKEDGTVADATKVWVDWGSGQIVLEANGGAPAQPSGPQPAARPQPHAPQPRR